jgi:hypothetical protein
MKSSRNGAYGIFGRGLPRSNRHRRSARAGERAATMSGFFMIRTDRTIANGAGWASS